MKEKKTASVKRQLIRYIRDSRLETGAKMLSQQELRMKFVCGAATLTNALAELAQEGVVEIRERIGVFVRNAKASDGYSRRVGILVNARYSSPFITLLHLEMENALSNQDCRTIWFRYAQDGDKPHPCGIDDIPGLRQAIREGEIDGVISMMVVSPGMPLALKGYGIPMVEVMNSTPGANHFSLDFEYIINGSVERLVRAGIQKIELMVASVDNSLADFFLDAVKRHGLDGIGRRHVHIRGFNGLDDTYSEWMNGIFHDWLNRPQDDQPQGIIIPDDMLALHFRLFLLKNTSWQSPSLFNMPFQSAMASSSTWCPEVLALYNSNLGMPILPTNVGYWQLDVREMAEKTVERFLFMMRNGLYEVDSLRFHPTFDATTVV